MVKEIYENMCCEQFIKIELRELRKGQEFKRKPDAHKTFYRGHYNRKDFMYPASYNCISDDDCFGDGICLSPKTQVYIFADPELRQGS